MDGETANERYFQQGEIEHYQAWAQFHQPPFLGAVVAPGSVIEFNKYPVFRGRIQVKPPLGPENAVILERLAVMEHCHSRRWKMSAVAAKLGVPMEEAVAKYGPEGEFFDPGQHSPSFSRGKAMVEHLVFLRDRNHQDIATFTIGRRMRRLVVSFVRPMSKQMHKFKIRIQWRRKIRRTPLHTSHGI